jgi:hypothetical protein
VLRNIEV